MKSVAERFLLSDGLICHLRLYVRSCGYHCWLFFLRVYSGHARLCAQNYFFNPCSTTAAGRPCPVYVCLVNTVVVQTTINNAKGQLFETFGITQSISATEIPRR